MIGAPQVEKVTIKLESIVGVGERTCKIRSPTRTQNSNYFTIIARNFSRENKYVKSVTLNGRPVTDWKIHHSDICRDGELVFEMTNRPRLRMTPMSAVGFSCPQSHPGVRG